MKKLLLFILLGFSTICFAVPMSGNYTIGATASNYTSITQAVTALINNGVSGAVVFDIKNGSYSGEYMIPLILGSSAVNTITFQSQSGNAEDVNLINSGSRVFLIQGKNFRFSHLTFSIYDGSQTTRNAIDLNSSQVDNVIISDCTFSGGSLTSSSFYNENDSSKSRYAYLVLNGDNITISNNHFYGGNSAMYRTNNPNFSFSDNITITNNFFDGTFITLVDLNRIRNLIFSGNRNIGTAKYLTISALQISGTSVFSENKFQTSNVDLPQGFQSFYLGGSTTESSEVTIKNNFLNSATHLTASYFNTVNLYNNSFKTARSYSLSLKDYTNLSSYNIYNNIFSTRVEYPNVRYFQALPFSKVNMNNNGYSKEDDAIQYFEQYDAENVYYDLSAWKAFASKDQNSLVVGDVYASSTDLHTPNAIMLNGAGIASSLVSIDIDGESRSPTPDIGADEFDMYLPTYRDLELVNMISPLNSGCEDAPFILGVKNNSSFAISNFTIECSLNDYRGNLTTYNQTIAAGQTMPIALNGCEINKNTFYDKFDFYISAPDNLLENNYSNNKLSVTNIFQIGPFVIIVEGNDCDSSKKVYVPKIGNTSVEWSTGETTNMITVSQPGNYTVTITGTNGCSFTQTITIN